MLKRVAIIAVGILLAVTATANASSESYKLVWSDEFDGETIDWSKWSKVPPVTSVNAAEWRKYTSTRDDLFAIENGTLVLKGIKNDGNDPNETRKFLCGQLWSKEKASFTYGAFEIRAKFENQQGAWPALWMLPEKNNWPLTGEIDIVERLNSDAFVHQTVHHGPVVDGSSTSDTSHENTINPEGWNVYRVEWTAQAITWYVNGVKTFTYAPVVKNENNWPFTAPFYMILSQQLGEEGTWVGAVDPETLPVNMYVDYVRVYQDEDDADFISIKGNREDLAFSGVETPRTLFRDRTDFQPLIALKAELLRFSQFHRLELELPEGVDQKIIEGVKLYKSSSLEFDLSKTTELWKGLTKTRSGKTILLSFQEAFDNGTISEYPSLSVGDYLLVGVKVSPDAPINAKLDAKITAVVVNGYFSWVDNANPRGFALVSDTRDCVLSKYLIITAFDPKAGTIEIALNAPFENGSVSVYGARTLNDEWVRVATAPRSTKLTIPIASEKIKNYNFYKVVIEDAPQLTVRGGF